MLFDSIFLVTSVNVGNSNNLIDFCPKLFANFCSFTWQFLQSQEREQH